MFLLRLSAIVRIALLGSAVTGHDDVSVLSPDAGVFPRYQVRVTGRTREPFQSGGQGEAVALRNPARQTHVPTRSVLPAVPGGPVGEVGQATDPFGRDRHARPFVGTEKNLTTGPKWWIFQRLPL
jgi:hypothetical protein